MKEELKERHKTHKNNFIRKRLISFSDLIICQLNMMVKSLSVELENWITYFKEGKSFSKQAFSKARKKFLHTAFIELNELYVSNFYRLEGFNLYKENYLLIAVDGSRCQVGKGSELVAHFGATRNQYGEGMPHGRASLMYDVLNRVVIDSVLAPVGVDEHTLYEAHCQTVKKRLPDNLKCLYLLDRGYPSFKKMIELEREGHKYVMRCSTDFCREVRQFIKEDKQEAELRFTFDKRRIGMTALKSLKNCPEEYKTRIVRVKVSDNEYEYLLTNTDFDRKELSELYFERWKVETFYGFLKGSMQLENFSSTNPEGVLKDFYARILTANLCELLIQEAQQELEKEQKEGNKYKYQVNRNIAVGILKDDLMNMIFSGQAVEKHLLELVERVKRHKTAIKPLRKFPRNKERGGRQKFILHKKRAL